MTARHVAIGAAVVSMLTILSGIAGIVVGGTSAMAGWWLVIVGGALLLAVGLYGRRAA